MRVKRSFRAFVLLVQSHEDVLAAGGDSQCALMIRRLFGVGGKTSLGGEEMRGEIGQVQKPQMQFAHSFTPGLSEANLLEPWSLTFSPAAFAPTCSFVV